MFRLFPLVACDPDERPGGAPWSADLDQRFTDPAVRAEVDTYLRDTWQPRMTKLETDLAGTTNARSLYDDLNGEKAAETFLAIGEALFGEEAAERMVGVLGGPEPVPAAPVTDPAAPAAADEPLDLDKLPAEVREVVAAHQTSQRNAAYRSELERVKGEHFADDKADDFLEREFALSVVACEGNMDKAVDHYNERMTALRPPAPEPEVEEAPPALGTQPGAGGGTADAPVTETYDSMDDALDSFLQDVRAPAPPAIGTV